MPEMEDDPRNFTVPPPGKIFYAGWIAAIVFAVARRVAGSERSRDV